MRKVKDLNLWIGTARDDRDLRAVLDAGIEAIVDLAMEEPAVQPTRELIYLRFPLVDGEGNSRRLLRTAIWAVVELVGSGVPTLVACGAGMSRSPGLVAVAVSRVKRTRPENELTALRSGGPIDLQPAFWRELVEANEA